MKKLVLVSLSAVLLFSCGEESDVQSEDATSDMDKALTTITELETSVIDAEHATVKATITQTPVQRDAELLLDSYKKFIAAYPDYDHAELGNMVLNTARIADQLGQMNPDLGRKTVLLNEACEYYQLAANDYADVIDAQLTLYAMALAYDFELNDQQQAKIAYERVVADYPGTLEAEQAALRLETIGLTPEELIEQFNSQQPQ